MRRLRNQCTGQQGVEGRRALRRIAKGMAPWCPKPGSMMERMLLDNFRPIRATPLTAKEAAGRSSRRRARNRDLDNKSGGEG